MNLFVKEGIRAKFKTLLYCSEFEACTRQSQREIQQHMVGCEPRDQVVPLTLPNSSYMSVVPTHVNVKRCAGSCSRSR